MNNHLKLSDFSVKILVNAILLGPVAIILFLIALPVLGADVTHTINDLMLILFFGSLICMFISLGASFVIYTVLVSFALRKQGTCTDHFKRFLPVLVIIFLIASTAMLLSIGGYSPYPVSMMISAYLTSAMGWYWLSRSIAKKQHHINSQSIK